MPAPVLFPANRQFNVATNEPQPDANENLSFGTGAPYLSKSYPRHVWGNMGIATDILNLRHNQLSSVTLLISALERFNNSSHERALNRLFQVDEAADLVLTNVAAHAAEALVAPQPTKGTTQRVISMRQRSRRFNSGPSTLQRQLFAVRSAS
jgi:hypothetical protein